MFKIKFTAQTVKRVLSLSLCLSLCLSLSAQAQILIENSPEASPQAIYERVQKKELSPQSQILSVQGPLKKSQPLLHWAIRQANLQLVKLLLEQGVNLNKSDSEGNTALMIAAWGNPAQNPSFLRFKQRYRSPAYHWRIKGEGFFTVYDQITQKQFYTRDAYFYLDENGKVTNELGYPLDPSIVAPPNQEPIPGYIPMYSWRQIIYATSPETLGWAEVANLQVIQFSQANALAPVGNGLFHQTEKSGEPQVFLPNNAEQIRIEDLSGIVDSPLYATAWNPELQIEFLKLFLDKGADLAHKNHSGADAFTVSLWGGQVQAALYLLNQMGLHENEKQSRLQEALLQGLQQSDFEMIQTIIEKGVTVPEHLKNAILTEVAQEGKLALLQTLIKKGYSLQMQGYETPLLAAARSGQTEVVQYLLGQGVDLEQINHRSETAVWKAAQAGQFDVLKLLLEKGARFNSVNLGQDTPLTIAVRHGQKQVLDYFLEHQSRFSENDWARGLLIAAERGDRDLVRKFIQKGIPVNISPSLSGNSTALIKAVEHNHGDLVADLLEQGADPKIKDENKKTALDYALEYGHDEIYIVLRQGLGLPVPPLTLQDAVNANSTRLVYSLVRKGLNLNQKLVWKIEKKTYQAPLIFWGIHKRDSYLVNFLIERGADVISAKDQDGNNALNWASGYNDKDLVAVLLKLGLNPSKANNRGITPLAHAVYNGNLEIVKLLTSQGADLKEKDHVGWTLLMTASFAGQVEVVKYLLSQKVDPKVKNNNGKTAMDLAQEKGHADVVNLLKGKK